MWSGNRYPELHGASALVVRDNMGLLGLWSGQRSREV